MEHRQPSANDRASLHLRAHATASAPRRVRDKARENREKKNTTAMRGEKASRARARESNALLKSSSEQNSAERRSEHKRPERLSEQNS